LNTRTSAVLLATVVLSATAVLVGAVATQQPVYRPAAASSVSGAAEVSTSARPLSFVANAGQFPAEVRFFAQSGGASMFFTNTEAVFTLLTHELEPGTSDTSTRRPRRGLALAMRFVGASRDATMSGRKPGIGKWNHVVGPDQSKWRTNLPTWEELVYTALWPGVDAVFRGRDGEIKYDFILKPGTDPSAIALRYDGARTLRLDASGNLVIETELGALNDAAPVSYQEINGTRIPVASRYALRRVGASQHVGFEVGDYDRGKPLVIDPAMTWNTISKQH